MSQQFLLHVTVYIRHPQRVHSEPLQSTHHYATHGRNTSQDKTSTFIYMFVYKLNINRTTCKGNKCTTRTTILACIFYLRFNRLVL